MTEAEKKLGLDRVRAWPRAEIDWAAKLTAHEQALLVLMAALLNVRPDPGG